MFGKEKTLLRNIRVILCLNKKQMMIMKYLSINLAGLLLENILKLDILRDDIKQT